MRSISRKMFIRTFLAACFFLEISAETSSGTQELAFGTGDITNQQEGEGRAGEDILNQQSVADFVEYRCSSPGSTCDDRDENTCDDECSTEFYCTGTPDVNECQSGSHNCEENANCQNIVCGGFSCTESKINGGPGDVDVGAGNPVGNEVGNPPDGGAIKDTPVGGVLDPPSVATVVGVDPVGEQLGATDASGDIIAQCVKNSGIIWIGTFDPIKGVASFTDCCNLCISTTACIHFSYKANGYCRTFTATTGQAANDFWNSDAIALPETCLVLYGQAWCTHPSKCGILCKETCQALGMELLSNSAVWRNAQNEENECADLAALFGMNGYDVKTFTYSCLQEAYSANTPRNYSPTGAPLLDQDRKLQCSSNRGCPANHLNAGSHDSCDDNGRLYICPCGDGLLQCASAADGTSCSDGNPDTLETCKNGLCTELMPGSGFYGGTFDTVYVASILECFAQCTGNCIHVSYKSATTQCRLLTTRTGKYDSNWWERDYDDSPCPKVFGYYDGPFTLLTDISTYDECCFECGLLGNSCHQISYKSDTDECRLYSSVTGFVNSDGWQRDVDDSPCPSDSGYYVGRFVRVSVASFHLCCKECRERPFCKHASYRSRDDQCRLFTSITRFLDTYIWESDIDSQCVKDPGTIWLGTSDLTKNVASFNDCCNLCLPAPTCIHFSHKANGNCWMFTATTGKTANRFWDSDSVDLCDGVNCMAQDQCHDAGYCTRQTGECSHPPKQDGTACDDGSSITINDVCNDGVCMGTGLCDGDTCFPYDECYEAGVCDPQTGECSTLWVVNCTPCGWYGYCQNGYCEECEPQCVIGAACGSDLCGGECLPGCFGSETCHGSICG